jgi:NADP-dependent 3-hydroxy acid dehydrogenase YdfG
MAEQLAGYRVLVTGASSGIGAATALALARHGAQVFATGRDRDALGSLEADGIRTLAGDLLAPDFPAALCDWAGDCDILVANAGRLKHAPFLDSRPEDWRAMFELNVLATLDLVQRVGHGMVARGSGHIVLVSSLLARRVTRNTMVYAASKHAVAAIAAGLRLELGPAGIRVSEIAPGLVRTRVFRDIDHPAARDAYAAMDFEFLQPDDVAAAILVAVTARPGASADLIELRPNGQP